MAASSAPSHSPFSDMCVASHAQEVEREKCTAQLECLNLKQKKFTGLGFRVVPLGFEFVPFVLNKHNQQRAISLWRNNQEETNCQTRDHSLAHPSIPDGHNKRNLTFGEGG